MKNQTQGKDKAYLYIIKLLTGKGYSRYKLELKLKSRGFHENEIAEAIEKIQNAGFFNESDYIESRIRLLMNKNFSSNYILANLNSEKIQVDIDLIENIFNDNKISEETQIKSLISKKMPANFDQLDDTQKHKLYSKISFFLESKGHTETFNHLDYIF